jgi:hypothetical protein
MNSYEVVFTIKQQVMHSFKEIVEAESVEEAKAEIEQRCKDVGYTLGRIVSVVQQ